MVLFLRSLFADFPREANAVHARLCTLSLSVVRRAMVEKWRGFWEEVQEGTRQSTKALFYCTHVNPQPALDKRGWYTCAQHFSVFMPGDVHSNLVRFRLGNHDLLVEKRRWMKPDNRDNFDCRCTFCSSGEKEDEHHFIFACIKYDNIRLEDRYIDLIESSRGNLRAFFCYKDQLLVAKFLSELITERM